MLYTTADRKQRVWEGVKIGGYVLIALTLLVWLILFGIWYTGWHTRVNSDNTAKTKTYSTAFQLEPTWGDCPLLINQCYVPSNIRSLTGPLKLASDPNITIGVLDGICISISYNGTEYTGTSKCSFTINFNGNGTVHNGTVIAKGLLSIDWEAEIYQDMNMPVTGGTGAYINPGSGLLFSTMDPDTTYSDLLNMTLTTTIVV